MTVVAVVLETLILLLYTLTFMQYQASLSARAEALRKQEMRKSVHRTMTGSAGAGVRRVKARGWEAGGIRTPTINVIPV